MTKKSIAIDMDGVLADVEAQALEMYLAYSGTLLTKADISGRKESEMLPDGLFHHFVNQPGFFRNLPIMEGAVEAVKELSETFDVFVVSAAMEFPLSLAEKHAWLGEHFPFISWKNIVFCGDKSVIKTDFMIDDHCKNLDFCHGKALLFAAFHNQGQNHHLRFDDWKGISEFFQSEIIA